MAWSDKAQAKDSPGGEAISFVEIADLARNIGNAMLQEVEPRYILSVEVKPSDSLIKAIKDAAD